MKHKMRLSESPFERILSGKKTIEIRLFDEKRKRLKKGDIIELYKRPGLKEKIKVEVVDLLRYETFRELFNDFGTEYYGYSKNYPLDNLLDSIYKIYSREEEKNTVFWELKLKF